MDFVHKVSSNRPRYKQIYDEISTAMHENTSLNGATVSLKSLEKIFQTSKTPIYQALQMLEVSGYATEFEKKASYILHQNKNKIKSKTQRTLLREHELKLFLKRL